MRTDSAGQRRPGPAPRPNQPSSHMPPPNLKPTREKPAHEFRLGAVKAAIWRNETDNGARYQAALRAAVVDRIS